MYAVISGDVSSMRHFVARKVFNTGAAMRHGMDYFVVQLAMLFRCIICE